MDHGFQQSQGGEEQLHQPIFAVFLPRGPPIHVSQTTSQPRFRTRPYSKSISSLRSASNPNCRRACRCLQSSLSTFLKPLRNICQGLPMLKGIGFTDYSACYDE